MQVTREQILQPATRRYGDFKTSDGLEFRVRSLTERERSEWEMSNVDSKGVAKRDRLLSARRRLVILTLVDQENKLIFQRDDEAALAEQDGRVIEEFYKAAAAHCGITDADVETLTKN